jgi:hypothetical protein
MKRALRSCAVALAAFGVFGCQGQNAPAGGTAAPLAYAPDAGATPSSPALRELMAAGAGNGLVVSGGTDSGRVLFDGARPGEGDVIPASYSVPAGAPRFGSARYGYGDERLASPGSRAYARRGEPPLPDDPGLLRAVAAGAGPSARGAGPTLLGFAADQIACGYEYVAPILSRVGWGAAPRRGRPVPMTPTHLTIHHTDGRQTMTEAETIAAVRSIQRFHMHDRGWEDIAYHFLIDGAGRVVEGRPAETLGAHVLGGNENNIGIAMMGDFERIHPTPAQVESLTRLASYLAVKYRQNPAAAGFVQPHRHYNQTDCPGRYMMSIFEDLRRKIDGGAREIMARDAAAPGRFQPVAVVQPVSA